MPTNEKTWQFGTVLDPGAFVNYPGNGGAGTLLTTARRSMRFIKDALLGMPLNPFVCAGSSNFVYPFNSATSLRTAITGGYHFKVLPVTGWVAAFNLWAYVVDTSGNLEGSLP